MTATGQDIELCHPTEGPIMAYYGQRAVTRKSTAQEPLHAVAAWSLLGGAMDAECGTIGAIEYGPWDPSWGPDTPGVCAKCAKFVTGTMPMRDELPPRRRKPAEAAVDTPVQLQIPDAA